MRAEFPTTLWTVIRGAGAEDSEAAERVAGRYRPAIVSFLRGQRFSEADSEDLAQEVFVRIFRERILARAEQSRGRFRSLLIAVTKQVMVDELRRNSAAKRGGGARRIPLEDVPDPETAMGRAVDDEEFDRGWAVNLLSLALARLREECERKGSRHHDALAAHLKGRSYAEIARSLESTVTNVSTWIRRARLRLRALVEDEIRAYSSSEDEFKHDTRRLTRFLSL